MSTEDKQEFKLTVKVDMDNAKYFAEIPLIIDGREPTIHKFDVTDMIKDLIEVGKGE